MIKDQAAKKYLICVLFIIAFFCQIKNIYGDNMENDKIFISGDFLDFNGQMTIPEKVFGVHGFPFKNSDIERYGIEMTRIITQKVDGNPIMPGSLPAAPKNIKNILECIYDRYQPALILEYKDWKERLISVAANFAKARQFGAYPQMIEFWNEPYLNWADRPGVNYDQRWFEKFDSSNVKIKTIGELSDLLVETSQLLAVRKDNGSVHYLASRYLHDYKRMGKYQDSNKQWLPFKCEEGFEFDFRGVKCVLKNLKWFRDKTQNSYYSSEFNSQIYRRMLKVFADELKRNAPDIKLIAGWGCNMWWDDWKPWKVLYKPVIDEAYDVIDGICEHHYACDVRMVAAEYELAYTYALTNYGKFLKFFNTEVGGGADPEQPGKFIPFNSGASPIQNMTYVLREISYLLSFYPDKIETMAFHEPQYSVGVLDAFLFLKNLRGKLLYVDCNVKKLWAVASIQNNQICLVVFNDNNKTVSIPVELCAPANSSVLGASKFTYSEDEKKNIHLIETKLENTDSKMFQDNLCIPKFTAVKYLIDLERKNTVNDYIKRKQFCAKDILLQIPPRTKQDIQIILNENDLEFAKFAKLRLVHSGISKMNTKIYINDQLIDFDFDGEYWTSEVRIPLSYLKKENKISIEESEDSNGFLLVAGSIFLFI